MTNPTDATSPLEVAARLDVRAADHEAMASNTDDWHSAMPEDVREGFKKEAADDRRAAALIRQQTALIHDLRDANTRAHNRNVALSHALSEAVAQFRIYEAHHLAKGTEESTAKAKVNHDLAARLEAIIKGQGTDLSAMLQDPAVVHVNMLRGGIAKPTPSQIGHLYHGDEAAEVVAEVTRQQGLAAPKVEQGSSFLGHVITYPDGRKPDFAPASEDVSVGESCTVTAAFSHPWDPAPASPEMLEDLIEITRLAWHDGQGFVAWERAAFKARILSSLATHKGPQS